MYLMEIYKMDALLSIKPKYVKTIISGEKKFEFRKKIFLNKINKVYIYSSSPDKIIKGYFNYNGFIEGSPEYIWEKCKGNAGISKTDFFKYFDGKDKAYALIINQFYNFQTNMKAKDLFESFTAPQSFMYVPQELESLLNKINIPNVG
jgi:predicted transcriptional regulator